MSLTRVSNFGYMPVFCMELGLVCVLYKFLHVRVLEKVTTTITGYFANADRVAR